MTFIPVLIPVRVKRRLVGDPGPPAPGALISGELAVNEVDGGLYYGMGVSPDGLTATTVVRLNPPSAVSIVPGPPGANSIVPGPPGKDSIVPGPPGAGGAVQVASFHTGKTVANEIVVMFIASQALNIPAGLTGMVFYAATLPAASVSFAAYFLQAGVWTTLGLVTVSPLGALLLPNYASHTLQPGDGYKLVGPATPDTALADFCFNVSFARA